MGTQREGTGVGEQGSNRDQSPIRDEPQVGSVSEQQAAARAVTSAEQPMPQPRVEVDDSNVVAGSVDFCRVSGTPGELILNPGLNSQPPNPTGAANKRSVFWGPTSANGSDLTEVVRGRGTTLSNHRLAAVTPQGEQRV